MHVRIENTTLKVTADTRQNLSRLVREEEGVIRNYVRQHKWPHRSVNLFVSDDLQLLVSQIENVTMTTSVPADDIDRRPIINVYNAADLGECAVFVNCLALKREGVWGDALALRALLAHEHGHALCENETVRSARDLSVNVATECGGASKIIAAMLRLLTDRLCVRAPHEVFAREIAIRAGFGGALFHLDKAMLENASLRAAKRASLALGLNKLVAEGKLTVAEGIALLLVGDLQLPLGSALNTTPLLRTKHRHLAAVLESAVIDNVLPHLDPAALGIYKKFRDHYLQLRPDLSMAETQHWCITALDLVGETLRANELRFRFTLARASASGEPRRHMPDEKAFGTRRARECNDGAMRLAPPLHVSQQGRRPSARSK